jgi:hypothetical protein
MLEQFVPIDFYDEDIDFVHVNPNIIVNLGIKPTEGTDNFMKAYPFTVTTLLVNLEEVDYYFRTREEAKVFIKKIGGINE